MRVRCWWMINHWTLCDRWCALIFNYRLQPVVIVFGTKNLTQINVFRVVSNIVRAMLMACTCDRVQRQCIREFSHPGEVELHVMAMNLFPSAIRKLIFHKVNSCCRCDTSVPDLYGEKIKCIWLRMRVCLMLFSGEITEQQKSNGVSFSHQHYATHYTV